VKVPSEDNPQSPDNFLLLMSYCFEHNISINANPMGGRLAVIGTEEPAVIQWIVNHYEQASHWLPGFCDGCERWSMTRTESYWGAHPHFCTKCLAWTVKYFDENGKWPEGNWFPGETFETEVDDEGTEGEEEQD
jgi:hypothetical protein